MEFCHKLTQPTSLIGTSPNRRNQPRGHGEEKGRSVYPPARSSVHFHAVRYFVVQLISRIQLITLDPANYTDRQNVCVRGCVKLTIYKICKITREMVLKTRLVKNHLRNFWLNNFTPKCMLTFVALGGGIARAASVCQPSPGICIPFLHAS